MTSALEQIIIDWVPTLGWQAAWEAGYPLVPGTEIRDSPDRLIFISDTGGPGFVTEEGAADASTFQVRLRGPADNPAEPSQKIRQLDQMILAAGFPAEVDGVWIHTVHRLGSPPTAMPYDPRSKRYEFTCQYVIVHGGL